MRCATLLAAIALLAWRSANKTEPAPTIATTDSAVTTLLRVFPDAVPRSGAVTLRDVRLPARSGGAARIESAVAPGVALEVTPLDVADVPSREANGVLSFPGALANGDLIWAASPDRIEELRLVQPNGGEVQARYRVHVTDGSNVVVRGDRVHVVDGAGRIVITGLPLLAIDARGTRRTPTATIDHDVLTVTVDTRDLVGPIAIDPAWSTGPAMILTRAGPNYITLTDNRLLVIGGEYQTSRYTAGTEAYDPSTGAWSNTGTGGGGISAAVAMAGSGRVVRAGGFTGLNPRKDASVFDPTTSTWTAVTPLFTWYVMGAAAARTGTNEVIVCGGSMGSGATGAECSFINTSTFTMTAAASMPAVPDGFAMITLADGRVLAAGGASAAAWRYTRSTNSWAVTGSTKLAYGSPTLTMLTTGKVLILGGSSKTGDVFDNATGTWSTTGSMVYGRSGHTATLLSDGRVLVAGGGSANAEIYNPITNTFSTGGAMAIARSSHAAGRLPDGRVLVAGDVSVDNSAEIWGRLLAQTCAASYECVNNQCVDGVCCSTASCSVGSSCNLAGKVGTCAKPNSAACAVSSECASGFCVDGVCCNAACAGQCSACNLTGKAGTCSAVVGAPVGGRVACGGIGAGTTCGSACNGSSLTACAYPSTTTACGVDSCSAGIETRTGTCNGAGACSSTSRSCGSYVCSGTSCLTTCTTGSDCVAGYYCKSGSCAPAEGLGNACTTAADCSTGFCTDGVCCGVANCGVGSSCAIAGHLGVCFKKLSTTCASEAECGSGHCIDAVCCESRCDGQCEACDVEGKIGRCIAVNGAPHGARAACSDGAGDTCAARTCKSTDSTSCAGYAKDSATTCAAPTCVGNEFVGASRCDGAGACTAPKGSSCVPYVCEATGCRKTCETDAHCTTGFACVAGRCEARAATCSDDRLSSVPPDGTPTSCVPYRCLDSGDCGRTCKYSSECAPGFVCDSSSSTCLPQPTGATEEDGGCVYGHGAGPVTSAMLLALVGLGLAARRRGAR
jgi:hypothetical protein